MSQTYSDAYAQSVSDPEAFQGWLAPHGDARLAGAAERFDVIAQECKSLILKVARVVNAQRALDAAFHFDEGQRGTAHLGGAARPEVGHVAALAEALRGVGQSQGSFDQGRGETLDLLAVTDAPSGEDERQFASAVAALLVGRWMALGGLGGYAPPPTPACSLSRRSRASEHGRTASPLPTSHSRAGTPISRSSRIYSPRVISMVSSVVSRRVALPLRCSTRARPDIIRRSAILRISSPSEVAMISTSVPGCMPKRSRSSPGRDPPLPRHPHLRLRSDESLSPAPPACVPLPARPREAWRT